LDDPSGESLRKSYLEQVQSHSWHSIAHEVLGFALIVISTLYVLYLLIVPVVAQGFNAKKAIFSGGRVSSPEIYAFGTTTLHQLVWERFPRRNVYKAEDDVFDALHIRKPPELQADLVFNAITYFACSTAAAAEALVFHFSPPWPVDVLAQIPLLTLVLLVMDERRLSQRRRLEGHA
jgi:hypothetical protein